MPTTTLPARLRPGHRNPRTLPTALDPRAAPRSTAARRSPAWAVLGAIASTSASPARPARGSRTCRRSGRRRPAGARTGRGARRRARAGPACPRAAAPRWPALASGPKHWTGSSGSFVSGVSMPMRRTVSSLAGDAHHDGVTVGHVDDRGVGRDDGARGRGRSRLTEQAAGHEASQARATSGQCSEQRAQAAHGVLRRESRGGRDRECAARYPGRARPAVGPGHGNLVGWPRTCRRGCSRAALLAYPVRGRTCRGRAMWWPRSARRSSSSSARRRSRSSSRCRGRGAGRPRRRADELRPRPPRLGDGAHQGKAHPTRRRARGLGRGELPHDRPQEAGRRARRPLTVDAAARPQAGGIGGGPRQPARCPCRPGCHAERSSRRAERRTLPASSRTSQSTSSNVRGTLYRTSRSARKARSSSSVRRRRSARRRGRGCRGPRRAGR